MALNDAQIAELINDQVDEDGAEALRVLRKVIARVLSVYRFASVETEALRNGEAIEAGTESRAIVTAAVTGDDWATVRASVPEFAARIETSIRARVETAAADARRGSDRLSDIREQLSREG